MVKTSYIIPAYTTHPEKDKRLSWPIWLIYSGRVTHISGHLLAVGRAQDKKTTGGM